MQEGMPDQRTVYRWLEKDREFCQQYARAREAQADKLFEGCLAIADEAEGDVVLATGEDGKAIARPNHANVRRKRTSCSRDASRSPMRPRATSSSRPARTAKR